MKKIFFLCILIFSFPSVSFANTFQKITVDGITFNNIIYDISSQDYKIHVATTDTVTNIDELAKSKNAITGINGVFFCPADYSECKGKNYTINERFENGADLSFYDDTGERAVFGWDISWVPLLHQTAKINPDIRDTIYEWMWNFPVLYADGKNQIEHYHDVWLYDKKMSTPMKRHFICSNKEKTKIFFGSTSSVTLDDLAPALFKLWCWDGLNLDAGNSTQYLYNGRRLEYSNRNVLDGFVIERVWLNVAESDALVETLMKKLTVIYKRYSQKKALSEIDTLLAGLAQIRSKLYDKNSVDTYDESGNITGYVINISSLPTLRRVYLINTLERKLQILRNARAKETQIPLFGE